MRIHLCLVLAAGSAVTAYAQTEIPLKPGLWESTTTTTMSGRELPPDMKARIAKLPPDKQQQILGMMGGAPQTHTIRSCMTKEQLEKMHEGFVKKPNGNQNCTQSNVTQSAAERSSDITCTTPAAKMTGHVAMSIDSDEKAHGSAHITETSTATTNPQADKPITIDVAFETHFISANCSGVRPGIQPPSR